MSRVVSRDEQKLMAMRRRQELQGQGRSDSRHVIASIIATMFPHTAFMFLGEEKSHEGGTVFCVVAKKKKENVFFFFVFFFLFFCFV